MARRDRRRKEEEKSEERRDRMGRRRGEKGKRLGIGCGENDDWRGKE